MTYLSDEEFRTIQQILNFVRVAELEKTPGIMLVLPEILGESGGGVDIKTAVHIAGHDDAIESMLTALLASLVAKGHADIMQRSFIKLTRVVAEHAKKNGIDLKPIYKKAEEQARKIHEESGDAT